MMMAIIFKIIKEQTTMFIDNENIFIVIGLSIWWSYLITKEQDLLIIK